MADYLNKYGLISWYSENVVKVLILLFVFTNIFGINMSYKVTKIIFR